MSSCPCGEVERASLTAMQEFSIEIPDKEADAIHSGTKRLEHYSAEPRTNSSVIVNQAVEYITSQPDGEPPR